MKNYPLKFLVAIYSLFFVFMLVWALYLQTLGDKTTVYNYLFNFGFALLFLGVCPMVVLSRKYIEGSTQLGKAFLFYSLASISYGIGLIIWVYYNLVAKVEVPYPSVADAFFIAFYPLMSIGIFFMIRIFSVQLNIRLIGETALILILASLLVLFVTKPDFSGELTFLNNILNLAYPIFDAVLLALMYLLIRISAGKFYLGLFFLISALFFQALADILFSLRTAQEIYWNGDISDILYTCSAFSLVMTILFVTDKMKPSQIQLGS